MKIFFKCNDTHPFDEVKEKLDQVKGVTSVAKLPGGKGAEEGMIEVDSQESGEAAVEAMQIVGCEFLGQPSNSEDAATQKRQPKKEKTNAKNKEFFDNFTTLKETRQRQKQEDAEKLNKDLGKGQGGNQRGRQQRGNSGGRKGSDGKARSSSGGRGGRGGRGSGDRGYNNSNNGGNYRSNGGRGGGRGRGRRGYVMPQFIEGHVASINNVPMSMTNDQIAKVFEECGTIYDIARYETLAMVYFDCQDSVLNAICLVNGSRKMNGSVSTVSDGGTLRVPIPRNLNPESLSPQFLHLHQQGMMAPLQNPAASGYAPPPGAPPGNPVPAQ